MWVDTKQWVYQSDTAIGQTIAYLKKEEILPMRAAIELALSIVFHPSAIQSMGGTQEQVEASIWRSKMAMAYYLDGQASLPLDEVSNDALAPDGMAQDDGFVGGDDEDLLSEIDSYPPFDPSKNLFSKEDPF